MSGLRLYLVRHAKAVAATGGMDDFDRPLATAGREAMLKLGAIVAREGYRPEAITCSSARRTRETLGVLLSFMPGDATIRLARKVYEAVADRLVELIAETDPAARSLMIIGHNPAIEEVAGLLVRATGAPQQALKFPTGALAVMDLEAVTWRDVKPKSAKLVAFHVPD